MDKHLGSINEHMPKIFCIVWDFVFQFVSNRFGLVWLMIIAGLTWPLFLKFSIDSQLPQNIVVIGIQVYRLTRVVWLWLRIERARQHETTRKRKR